MTTDGDFMERVRRWCSGNKEIGGQSVLQATLATLSPDGSPALRVVEIAFVQDDIAFISRRGSRKVAHLAANPKAALHIWLPATNRQLSMEGVALPLERDLTHEWWQRIPEEVQRWFIKEDLSLQTAIPMPDEFVAFRFIARQITFFERRYPQPPYIDRFTR